MTQEQAAERLGVSRQTVSNWETGKTYPDIISVIKMSDLYAVSLDRLLKGAEVSPVSEYAEYLAARTDTVRSREKLSLVILCAVYLGIWAVSLVVFWCFVSGSDAMGYSLVVLWCVIPITTFVVSLLMGRQNILGKVKWLAPAVFGLMYMLAEYATFSTANMVAFHKFNLPNFGMLLAGGIISAAGLGIGVCLDRMRRKKDPKKQ